MRTTDPLLHAAAPSLLIAHLSVLLLQVNSGPFKEGWMMKVKLSKPAETAALMDAKAYEKHSEEH